ncbi:MAG: YtxH domain-containing protein [Anaerolineales bacterium]|nr:YtxH domain-containing protein [Anaerolineales bacterium]
MTKEKDGDFGAYVSGFLLGGLVGAAVALLLAPQSGEETRALIGDKAIELKDQVDQKATEAITRAEELAGEAKQKATALQQQGKEIIDTQKTKLEKAIEAGKDALASGEETEEVEEVKKTTTKSKPKA